MKKRIIEYFIDKDGDMTALDTKPNTLGWLIAYLFCKYDNMIKIEMFDGYIMRETIKNNIDDVFLQLGARSIANRANVNLNSIKKFDIKMKKI